MGEARGTGQGVITAPSGIPEGTRIGLPGLLVAVLIGMRQHLEYDARPRR
jgi:hypothetical protein